MCCMEKILIIISVSTNGANHCSRWLVIEDHKVLISFCFCA